MTPDTMLRTSVALIAAVALSVAAYQAEGVFAPLTLALFIIALVWPMQHWLQARMPALIALLITMVATVAVMPGLARGLGLRPGGAVADRRREPLSGDLRHGGRVARRARRFGRGLMGAAF